MDVYDSHQLTLDQYTRIKGITAEEAWREAHEQMNRFSADCGYHMTEKYKVQDELERQKRYTAWACMALAIIGFLLLASISDSF